MLRYILLFSFSTIWLMAAHAQVNLHQVGHLAFDNTTLAGCWHYVDAEQNEYGLIGTSNGLSIVNLNEPTAPYIAFEVPGPINNWREVKTYGGYAYVSTEAANSGITIVDLNYLPDSIKYKTWTGDSDHPEHILSAHALAATDGFLYVFGSKPINNGAIVCDLTDPWNPTIIGNYSAAYIHDGYIRNDTLWAGEIYAGQFSVIDLKDKTAPQLVTNQPTPGLFNHNTWLSNDSKTLYTTDEKPNTPLASFDITDLDNITLLDTYYPSQLPSKEVHNVRVHNDFLINPSYGGQLTIVDAHRPQNLVETAWAILGTSLVWDADPYLPSGIVFATAKNEGLFIYQPTYTRAAYLEGRVRDSLTNDPIKGASIRIVNTIVQDSTNVQGYYTTGYHSPGFWTIEVSCPGYQSKSIPLVEIKTAQVTTLDIVLAQASTAYSDIKNQQKFRIYPSAFIDGITVEAMGIANENAYLELTDLFGKLLYSAKIKDGKQRVEWGIQWAPGHYLLTLKGKSGLLHTERLIKS